MSYVSVSERGDKGPQRCALSGRAEQGNLNESRSLDPTFVGITPMDGDWRAGIARCAQSSPTRWPARLAGRNYREAAEMNVAYMIRCSSATCRRLADEMVEALDIHETVAARRRRCCSCSAARYPCHAAGGDETTCSPVSRSAPFTSPPTPGMVTMPPCLRLEGAGCRACSGRGARWCEPCRHAQGFADLPPIGPVGPAPNAPPTGLREIERLDIGNGVTALFWPTQDDPGRVNVKVRFGAGFRAFGPGDAPMSCWAIWRWSVWARGSWVRRSWSVSANGREDAF